MFIFNEYIMKKILISILVLFCAIYSYAQSGFPNNQTVSNGQTLYHARGGLTGDSGLVLISFPDTTTANFGPYIKYTDGLLIKVHDTIFMRDLAKFKWINYVQTNVFTTNCISHKESGSVIWDSLLVFHSTLFNYFIGCRPFSAQPTSFTLDPAYVTAGRTDVWIVDTFGIISVLKGDSSGLVPQADPASQLIVAYANIAAGAVVPTNITNEGVYKENVEWVGTSDIPGTLFNYATFPYAGLLSTYVPSFTNLQFVQWTDNTVHEISNVSFLSLRLRLDAAFPLGSNLNVSFYNSTTAITNTVMINDGQYGFNANTVGSYQFIAIPTSSWALTGTGTDFDAVKFTLSGTGGAFQIDNVILQTGGINVSSTGVITFTGGNGGIPRDGNVIFEQTDDIWSYRSSQFNADTSYEYHYNSLGQIIDSTWVPKTPVVGRSGVTIKDTAINGIAAKVFFGTGGSGTVTSAVDSIWRTAGDDSIKFSINGLHRSILDSTGGGNDSAYLNIGSVTGGFTLIRGNGGIDTVLINTGISGISELGTPAYGLLVVNDSTYDVDSSVIVTRARLIDELALKQDVLSLTTNGTSGAATLVGPVLNIPQYSGGTIAVDSIWRTAGQDSIKFSIGGRLRSIIDSTGAGGTGWLTTGNAATDTATNFVGTTDYVPLLFRINGKPAGYISDSIVNNTAYGFGALRYGVKSRPSFLATAQGNAAFGTYALEKNTTGATNTAIGNSAMRANTIGSNNTAFGNLALTANISGVNNTAIGFGVLQTNIGVTNGADNTAVGYQAMNLNTEGYENTAIGNSALKANVAGFRNVAVGHRALFALTGAVGSNTAVGYGAAIAQTSGFYNTSIGAGALALNLTSANNTGVGGLVLGQATGAANIAIGYTAGYYGVTTESGKLFINAYTRADKTGDTTESIIYGQMSATAALQRLKLGGNGTVGINGYATSTFSVNGSVAAAYVAKTGTYTATISDYTIECTANTFTVTLPTAVGITGRIYNIVNSGAGTITIATTSSQTFVNVVATPTTLTMAAVGTITVQSNGANWMQLH